MKSPNNNLYLLSNLTLDFLTKSSIPLSPSLSTPS